MGKATFQKSSGEFWNIHHSTELAPRGRAVMTRHWTLGDGQGHLLQASLGEVSLQQGLSAGWGWGQFHSWGCIKLTGRQWEFIIRTIAWVFCTRASICILRGSSRGCL